MWHVVKTKRKADEKHYEHKVLNLPSSGIERALRSDPLEGFGLFEYEE